MAVHPANPSRPRGLPAIVGPANITLNATYLFFMVGAPGSNTLDVIVKDDNLAMTQ